MARRKVDTHVASRRATSPQFVALGLIVLVVGAAGALWFLSQERAPKQKAPEQVEETEKADPFAGMPPEERPSRGK